MIRINIRSNVICSGFKRSWKHLNHISVGLSIAYWVNLFLVDL
jgi:hypothetical protein